MDRGADRLGWCVVVTGIARTITDSELLARYESQVQPWVDIAMTTTMAITSQIINGVRLIEPGPATS